MNSRFSFYLGWPPMHIGGPPIGAGLPLDPLRYVADPYSSGCTTWTSVPGREAADSCQSLKANKGPTNRSTIST